MLISRTTTKPGSEEESLMVMKFWFIVTGIYIWEFVTTLDYEWRIFRGHQPYRRTIWIYSISRLSGLTVIINVLIGFDVTSEINCQAWITTGWMFSALGGYGLGSILIMLRIFAIWERNKVIMAISAAIWLINLGFQLAGIAKIRAIWVPAASACVITNLETCRGFYTSLLATDVILLLIMLVGLLRLRHRAKGSLELARLLWQQGVIWLVIATAAELPQVVLLFLDVNYDYNTLFLLPAMVTIIIAATRTYRSLTQYGGPTTTQRSVPDSSGQQRSNRFASNNKDTSIVHIPSNRLEVTVHKAYDEYTMSQTNHYGSYRSSDTQLPDESHELGSNENVEGPERET